jgi:hypothetical protein
MYWAQLGPLGAPIDLLDVAPVQIATERRGRADISLSGRRYVQSATRAPRTWAISRSLVTPAEAAFLAACAQGAISGDLYLLTADAAVMNLLPPHLAAPGARGDTSLGPVATSPASVTVTGVGPMVGVASAAAAGSWSQTVPVRPSVLLGLSCWMSAGSSVAAGTTVLQARTVDAAGAELASYSAVTATTSTTSRASVTILPAATAVGVQVRTSATAGRSITALRLTEGTPAGTEWVAGRGGAQVVVEDADETLNLISGTTVRSDYAWLLREVG